MFTQAVLGTKEGITGGITDIIGSKITDAILRTSDSTFFKGIDECQLYELFGATVGCADRPTTSDIRDQLQDILGTTFNYQQKIITNVE